MKVAMPRACAIAALLVASPALAQIHLHDREGLRREEVEAIRDADVLCADGWRELRDAAPRTQRLALVLSLGLIDNGWDEAVAWNLLEDYVASHPGVQARYERVGSLEALTSASRLISEAGSSVEALWVMSHGNEDEGEPVLAFTERDGSAVAHPASVVGLALAGLRYAPNASVYFYGCRLLAGEGPENLALLADAMGLTTGRLYANETDGLLLWESLSPAAAASGSNGCLLAGAALLSLPLSDLADGLLANRGWTLIRLPGRSCTHRILGRDMLRRIQAE